MSHLSEQFVKNQKLKLLQEKERLENELKILERFPQFGEQEEDNTEEVDAFYASAGEDAQMLMIYKNINIALKKIKNNSYGICDNCNKPIPKERLEVLPWATTCLECEK